jgi:ribosome maturation factor RimP
VADPESLERLIEPEVRAAGFELVRVALVGGRNLTLQVMAEDPATGQMTLDQCARLSRRLSALLDETDPIESEYVLEVSSPGIDRPLTRPADYDRWAGHVAKVELGTGMVQGGATRKRFQGRLLGRDGDHVRMAVDGMGEVALPMADIRTAKLVLTDALIAETRPLDSAGADAQEFEDGFEDHFDEDDDGPPPGQEESTRA